MPRYRHVALIGLAAAVTLLPGAVRAQSTQSLGGTWKLNVAKSTFDPADLATKSGVATYTFTDKTVTTAVDQVNAKGQKVHVEYTATLDGADSPWKGTIDGKPNTGQDGVSFKKLNDHTYHIENKLKGKVMTINHIVVAADGKTRTSTTTGTNADGVKIHNVAVYEKQ